MQENVECNLTELCLQGSEGARCAEETEFALPWMSCDGNSGMLKASGSNIFSPQDFTCSADCPKDHSCNMNTCLCEENKKNPPPQNPCPEPKFTNKYFDPPEISHTYDDLVFAYLNDPENGIEDLWIDGTLPHLMNIPAYEHMRGGVRHIIPFPESQLLIQPFDGPSVLPEEPFSEPLGGCANDYFVGEKALTIDRLWLDSPSGEQDYCVWGGVDAFMGVLTVCPEDVADWFDRIVIELEREREEQELEDLLKEMMDV